MMLVFVFLVFGLLLVIWIVLFVVCGGFWCV